MRNGMRDLAAVLAMAAALACCLMVLLGRGI